MITLVRPASLEIKYAWSGPGTETSLTPLIYSNKQVRTLPPHWALEIET